MPVKEETATVKQKMINLKNEEATYSNLDIIIPIIEPVSD